MSEKVILERILGELGEGMPWQLVLNSKTGKEGRCKHCSPIELEQRQTAYGEPYTVEFSVCPRVVRAFNEAGHNCTEVCLDCILEAAAELP